VEKGARGYLYLMGKQTAVALTAADEADFLGFLRSRAEVKLLASSGPSVEALWVEAFEPKHGHGEFYGWNTEFQWIPEYGTVTADPTGARNGYRYIRNSATAPLIEYTRHNFQGARATYGRVYWCKSSTASHGSDYDAVAFDKWYSSVVRWLRKNGKQAERGVLNPYYLPDAWRRYGQALSTQMNDPAR
jgi:hypothetical protein